MELALLGGEPVVPEGSIKPWPHITEADRRAVMEVFDTPASSGAPGITDQQRIQFKSLAKEQRQLLNRINGDIELGDRIKHGFVLDFLISVSVSVQRPPATSNCNYGRQTKVGILESRGQIGGSNGL